MKESNLAAAIDKAAEQRAAVVIRDIRAAINNALRPHWRSPATGEQHIGDDIRKILATLAISNSWDHEHIGPSTELIDACRGAIINDLLNGLPKLRELSMMAEINSDSE